MPLSVQHRRHIGEGLRKAYVTGRKLPPPGRQAKVLCHDPEAMAYITGAFLGDGNAWKTTRPRKATQWYLRFYPGFDRSFAESICHYLRRLGLFPKIHVQAWRNDSGPLQQLLVLVYSKALYAVVIRGASHLREEAAGSPVLFLKGLWDAEGYKTIPNFRVDNTGRAIIDLAVEQLHSLGCRPHLNVFDRRPGRKPLHRLRLRQGDTNKLWALL